MKVHFRRTIDEQGSCIRISEPTLMLTRFPILSEVSEDNQCIINISSIPYHDVDEFYAAQSAIKELDKNEEFIIETPADYDKFVKTFEKYNKGPKR